MVIWFLHEDFPTEVQSGDSTKISQVLSNYSSDLDDNESETSTWKIVGGFYNPYLGLAVTKPEQSWKYWSWVMSTIQIYKFSVFKIPHHLFGFSTYHLSKIHILFEKCLCFYWIEAMFLLGHILTRARATLSRFHAHWAGHMSP